MISNCAKCGGHRLKIDSTYPYHDIYECLDCQYTKQAPIEDCCRKPFQVVSILRYDHDRSAIYHQCFNCGGADKTKHLKSKVYNELIRAEFSQFRFEDWKTKKREESNLIYEGIKHFNYKNSNAYKYHNYINSVDWKQKRIMVLERDNNLCQHCKTKDAEDIHHLTYDNLYNEPLEDLQSLCRACHINIHREQNLKKIIEK